MNEKFYDLKKEKQDRMINAGLKIFALNGYKHASTDDIVVEARISKGLLFHYFDSKIGFYGFLFDYASHFAVVELEANADSDETDYFAIQRRISVAETKLERQYPYIFLFLDSVVRETSEEALSAVSENRTMVDDCKRKYLSAADFPALGYETIDSEGARRLTNIITFTKRGLLRRHLDDGAFQAEYVEGEVEAYLAYLEALVKNGLPEETASAEPTPVDTQAPGTEQAGGTEQETGQDSL